MEKIYKTFIVTLQFVGISLLILSAEETGSLIIEGGNLIIDGKVSANVEADPVETDGDPTSNLGVGSIALGVEAQATGDYSAAFGIDVGAEGVATFVSGMSNFVYSTASNGAILGGNANNARGSVSVILGGVGNSTVSGKAGAIASGDNTVSSGNYSFSMGSFTVAGGDYSIAQGEFSEANGHYSLAIGDTVYANGLHSVVFGKNNTASQDYTLIMGRQLQAAGTHSLLVGSINAAQADYTFMFGMNSDSSQPFTYSFGSDNVINGSHSLAIGDQNFGRREHSLTFGSNNDASSDHAVAIGRNLVANTPYEFVIGRHNLESPVVYTHEDDWSGDQPLFVIGNGWSYATRSNAFTVLKNGNVGIGNIAAADLDQRLEVDGNVVVNGSVNASIILPDNTVIDDATDLGTGGLQAGDNITFGGLNSFTQTLTANGGISTGSITDALGNPAVTLTAASVDFASNLTLSAQSSIVTESPVTGDAAPINVVAGDSTDGIGGNVVLSAGDSDSGTAGSIVIAAGENTSGAVGKVEIDGVVEITTASDHLITFPDVAGVVALTSDFTQNNITFGGLNSFTQTLTANGGISTGSITDAVGNPAVTLTAASVDFASNLTLSAQSSILTASPATGDAAPINVVAGDSTDGIGGNVVLSAGDSDSGAAGSIAIAAGENTSGAVGKVAIDGVVEITTASDSLITFPDIAGKVALTSNITQDDHIFSGENTFVEKVVAQQGVETTALYDASDNAYISYSNGAVTISKLAPQGGIGMGNFTAGQ